ncbi:hypothetical protein KJ991_02975 [Patescibacteria group bacterium]|nr:hypothetical protein [Patescibacteria group bacterium]MBU4057603.1 hypothetical protein [Patescibacteria group bacterium]MBU4115631.1 hypothetical protein [Patescibacteria group bacterium]
MWRDVAETFSAKRDGAGTNANDVETISYIKLIASDENLFDILFRSYILFDTSSVGDGAIISSAVFSGYYNTKANGLGTPSLHLASSTPASNTALVPADYQQIGRTSFGSITYASFTINQYNDITLNANGINNINKTGISKFSLQLGWDIDNSFTGTWTAFANSAMNIYSAEQTDTSQDPKLVVTYTVPASPKQDVIWFD